MRQSHCSVADLSELKFCWNPCPIYMHVVKSDFVLCLCVSHRVLDTSLCVDPVVFVIVIVNHLAFYFGLKSSK